MKLVLFGSYVIDLHGKIVETKPGVEFVVEPGENHGKQLSMIP
jgi:hypothetical protein